MQGVRNGKSKRWTDEVIVGELGQIAVAVGYFPSASDLRDMGRNELVCAATKSGGLMEWAARLGLERRHSDSDTGWDGEEAAQSLFVARGIACTRTPEKKAPYDLLAAGVLRIDVKTARYAEYARGDGTSCSGWFYRIGKHPQADLVLLYQLDTGRFYGLPWWVSPTANVTIAPGTSKYAPYADNWPMIERMIEVRRTERTGLAIRIESAA